MSEAQFTPWFASGVKPVRAGVYQTYNAQEEPKLGYQRWDGRSWFSWSSTPHGAAASKLMASPQFQDDPWRGLASDPNAQDPQGGKS